VVVKTKKDFAGISAYVSITNAIDHSCLIVVNLFEKVASLCFVAYSTHMS